MKTSAKRRLAPAARLALFLGVTPMLTAFPQRVAIDESFASDPLHAGWSRFGAEHLFQWNPEREWLEVTWDTDAPNSFFFQPLGFPLTRLDDFSLELDLRLDTIEIEFTGPYGFQIAFGLINLEAALEPGFSRGTGTQSPNLVEFNYFPDTGFGATVSPVIISRDNQFAVSFNFPLELDPGHWFTVKLSYLAGEELLRTEMTREGEPFGPIQDAPLPDTFTDFAVDAFALAGYNDGTPDGRILASGAVDRIRVVTPPLPVTQIRGAPLETGWEITFQSQAGWRYTLEATPDFSAWTPVNPPSEGTGSELTLADPEPPPGTRFYRVRAERD